MFRPKSLFLTFALTTANSANGNGNFDLFDDVQDDGRAANPYSDASDYIVDIREYDVPYHVRVMIDLGTCNNEFYATHDLIHY
jgi:DNA polymerase epsilon subunit 1